MSVIEQIIRFLAPHECISCSVEGSILCQHCSLLELKHVPDSCYRCNRLSPSFRTCSSCQSSSHLRRVWVRAEYTSLAKGVIYELKFSHAREAAKLIAREMARLSPALPDNALLVHIPAATSHIRQRSFDQSALIARELSKLLGLSHINGLARLGQQHQVGAKRQVRKLQMAEAFRPLSLPVIRNSHVLLVDDVLTTGATLEAAARTLRKAGVKHVDAIVFAKVK